LLLLYNKFGSSALRYPVTINDFEICQNPWFGKIRRICWDEVDRIQVLDNNGHANMRAYRVRIFSNACVIAFTNQFSDFYELIEFIQDRANKYNIPIYQEDTVGATRVVVGSWGIDASGKSAGITLTRIQCIPSP
jgi:hypothetical protein